MMNILCIESCGIKLSALSIWSLVRVPYTDSTDANATHSEANSLTNKLTSRNIKCVLLLTFNEKIVKSEVPSLLT